MYGVVLWLGNSASIVVDVYRKILLLEFWETTLLKWVYTLLRAGGVDLSVYFQYSCWKCDEIRKSIGCILYHMVPRMLVYLWFLYYWLWQEKDEESKISN